MMDFDIFDWMIISPMAEDFAENEKEMKKIEKDYFDDEDGDQDEDDF